MLSPQTQRIRYANWSPGSLRNIKAISLKSSFFFKFDFIIIAKRNNLLPGEYKN